MAADSYSQALMSRRGKSIDPNVIQIHEEAPQDIRKGFSAGDPADEGAIGMEIGEKPSMHAAVDAQVGITPQMLDPDQEHLDEHTQVDGEASRGAPLPVSQSPTVGGGELGSEIRDHVSGHASEMEYNQLKGMKPRSLGERAKMDALKSKFGEK